MKIKFTLLFALLPILALCQSKADTVASGGDDDFSGYYFYGIPFLLLLVVGFAAYKFLFERKSGKP